MGITTDDLTKPPQWTGPVRVMCPHCFKMGDFKSIEALQEYIQLIFRAVLKISENRADQVSQDIATMTREQLGDAAVLNSRERMEAILETDGMLYMECWRCYQDKSEKYLRERGEDVVRVGQLIFDRKYYKAHRKECREFGFKFAPAF